MPTFPMIRAIDPLLTSYASELSQSMDSALQEVFFPVKRVRGETGTYYEFDANNRFRNYTDYRADGGEANAIDWRLTHSTFSLEEYALKTHVTDRERENALDPISVDQDAVSIVNDSLSVAREIRARNLIFAAGFTPEFTASTRWDQAAATPLADNETIRQTFQKQAGRLPNTLVIPMRVWSQFMDVGAGSGTIGGVLHERLKYTMATTSSNITPNLIGQLFNVPNVIVGSMIYTNVDLTNTVRAAGDGIGNASTDGLYIWDKHSNDSTDTKEIIYAYINPGAGVKSINLGWTFQSQPYTIFRYREDKLRKDWIEGSRVEQQKIVAAACLLRARVLT